MNPNDQMPTEPEGKDDVEGDNLEADIRSIVKQLSERNPQFRNHVLDGSLSVEEVLQAGIIIWLVNQGLAPKALQSLRTQLAEATAQARESLNDTNRYKTSLAEVTKERDKRKADYIREALSLGLKTEQLQSDLTACQSKLERVLDYVNSPDIKGYQFAHKIRDIINPPERKV